MQFDSQEEMDVYIKKYHNLSLVQDDIWNSFTVNFSIYYPIKQDVELMRIQGDTLNLGNWGCKIPGYNEKEGDLHAKIMK